MWRYLIPVGLFGALIVFFFFGLDRDKETLPSPLIGKPAPMFDLQRLDDPAQKVGNAAFAGKPYVLNVWGSWCIACRHEHETLMEIARRGEVPLIGLNWRDDRATALLWLSRLGNPYVMNAFDEEGSVAIDWGVYAAPETFLVDGQGEVIHKQIGPLTLEIWERDFVPKLRHIGTGQ